MMFEDPLIFCGCRNTYLLIKFQTKHRDTVSWSSSLTRSNEAFYIHSRDLELSVKAMMCDTGPICWMVRYIYFADARNSSKFIMNVPWNSGRMYQTGSSSTCPLFLRTLSVEGTTKRSCNYINKILKFFLIAYYNIYYLNYLLSYFLEKSTVVVKNVSPFCVCGFWVFFRKSPFSIFTYQKSSQIFRESLCRTLSEVGEIEKYLQYP